MTGMGLGLGLGLGLTNRAPAQIRGPNGGPELLLQAEIVIRGDKTSEGVLVCAAALPWMEIANHLRRDSHFIFQFAKCPSKFEEFLAACYEKAGFDEVILTPQRGDRGRDVIAVKKGHGSVRFLDQAKAYSPGHLVTHDDVRSMIGALNIDQGASKGIITTTSDFQPNILKSNSEFAPFLPHRLELKNGASTLDWIQSLAKP